MPLSEEEHNSLMRTGLNLISQALSIFDSELKLVVCNRRYQEMFDLPPAYVAAGVSFEETIRLLVQRGEYGPVDDEEKAVQTRVKAARAFVPHYMERLRSNGRWVSVEGFPLPQGGWVTVYTDITEVRIQQQMLRTRSAELSEQLLSNTERLSETIRELSAANTAIETAKSQLAEMEARTRLTTEMMPAHIAHVDRSLRYTYTNRRLSSLIPGRPSQIIGMTGLEALGEASFSRIKPHLLRALAGEASVCEFTDEETGRRIRTAFNPDRIDDGPINGVYILSTDITEESQVRAAVLQTRKRELAAQLTSGLAHDFANLLTIILGLQTRLEQMDLPPGAAELVGPTLAAARRGGILIDRISSISGQKEQRHEAVDIKLLLKDLQMLAGPVLPDHIRLDIENTDVLKPLILDAGALQDSLLNLILNAKDAIGTEAGVIRIRARRVHDTWIEFSVTDTGSGFSPQALAHAFDPFFTTKGGEGSGLGLSMVYDQATIAGGTVRLENRADGGARVELRLPYREAPASDQQHLILLVEDNHEIREAVRDMLRSLGHSVVEATSADEAERMITIPGLGLVLTDLNLKGERNGLELAENLHGTQRLPVGVMTSLPASAPLRQAAESRYPLLPKPFDDRALARFIPRVVG
ncbi:PAS-domain containing protein (plasmid) [Peteryoungia desertarenae]|uniref:histidine kinase n=1 Tax=Peteryoungia desertarenae TaxID=1813451 RepID=A0ABX6QTV7_9HYPH|nr:PAS-domain containing protein [Peteryoungia desertarenae]QLF71934.1 PAS-domain containing protein [Peteryoungia desertarenae]